MPADIVVAGHIALDILPDMSALTPEQVIGAGKVYEIGRIAYSTGGAVSNTGLALHRLGLGVALQAVVGDDWIGRAIIDYVRGFDERLGEHIRILPDSASPYTVVIEPQNHDRTLLTHTGVYKDYGAHSINYDLLAGCKLFHLGYPTLLPRLYAVDGAEFLRLLSEVKARGTAISIDMSLPPPDSPSGRVDWRALLRRCLPLIDIFVPSIEEIVYMLRRDDWHGWRERLLDELTGDYLAALADELLAMGAGIAGFKLGERGLYLRAAADTQRLAFLSDLGGSAQDWAGAQSWQPAFAVQVAGTTGAGDAAYAGLLAALLRGMNAADCARWACAVAACNIEAADATTGVRSWGETAARLQAGWATRA
ncbi:MAG: carbohydrate kinase family protein [Chloroflexi bacterium]|nr:carbohydrate kinase family protein [Chloroflexota bacterium]MCY3582620.1 carbohydrate kinase family protein [Chloroflexota bacterium]MCY3715861.1 carbohydrate kinase family protein [Chloroflexota bacterium]MDE2649856.1 carbohydrate kinase family protein [Chloroflexota bacterium]MXX50521.1 carbohydrate kinase family protein [Chloroflexota bacterium]